jgi:hypothetical protein
MNVREKRLLMIVIGFSLLVVSCHRNRYEVIERTEKEVPNFMATGTHDEVHYVLLNGGHKFYATCDWKDLINLDPRATCAFRPLRTYECVLNNDPKKKDPGPLSDLKCKDDNDNNVYLYVDKKE